MKATTATLPAIGRPKAGRVAQIAGLGLLAAFAMTTPSFAATGGGDVTGMFTNAWQFIQTGPARALAILGIMFLGFAGLTGRLNVVAAASICIAIVLIFGAPTIVDIIAKGTGG